MIENFLRDWNLVLFINEMIWFEDVDFICLIYNRYVYLIDLNIKLFIGRKIFI